MTDRESLELAAKACGYEGAEWHEYMNAAPSMVIPYGVDRGDGVTGYLWNPLTNDGDAFRLAVRLEMLISHRTMNVDVARGRVGTSEYVPTYSDRCEATRRAITRAAAEIGRRMKS